MSGTYNTTLPIILIGGSGHAKVLVSTLRLQGRKLLGFVDRQHSLPPLLGVPNLGDDSAVFFHSPAEVRLVNGVGSVGSAELRRSIYENFRQRQYRFESVIHPSAIVAAEVEIEAEAGVQVMAGAIVQPGSFLGSNSIVNTGAGVDHDCRIGAHAHIAPGATLSGNVYVGDRAHVGTGASVIQGIRIGEGSVVGAGAVVINDVPAGATVVGVPARAVSTLATR
jgi:sugar O-acyltransferase (sialic acid O-acetyltransferase NeuD family)